MQVQPRRAGTVLTAVAVAALVCALVWWASDLLSQTAIVDRAATCRETECFCEHEGGFPVQLMNSISSFAFIAAGAAALLARPAIGTRERALAPCFAAALMFIGASSFFYHSTLSFLGQFLDVFSMYTFGLLLLAGALYRAGRLRAGPAIVGVVIASILLGVLQFTYPDARRLLFTLILVPGIILEMLPAVTGDSPRSRRVWAIYAALAIMLVAYVLWILDQTSGFCNPTLWLQGHALWHTLGAVAGFLVVVHHRRTAHPAG